jgi:hypothetical protein
LGDGRKPGIVAYQPQEGHGSCRSASSRTSNGSAA